MLIKYLLKSSIFFLKSLFFKQSFDVIFSYDYKLKNGAKQTPALLLPFIEFCKKKGYRYIIFEDVDLRKIRKDKELSLNSIPMTSLTLLESILKRLYKLFSWDHITNRKTHINQSYEDGSIFEVKRGKEILMISKISKFFFRNISCPNVITLVSNRSYLWRQCFPNARIYDYQHGVIFNGDANYLNSGRPPEYRIKENLITLVYSNKIKNLLKDNDLSDYYSDKNLIVLGKKKNKHQLNKTDNQNLSMLFSCQNASDGNQNDLNYYYSLLINFFNDSEDLINELSCSLILRNHPRAIASENPILKFPFFKESTNNDIYQDLHASDLHLTMNSSSVFEASELGIPTIFLELDDSSVFFPTLASKKLYLEQFDYPFEKFFVSSASDLRIAIDFYLSQDINYLKQRLVKWHDMMIEEISEAKVSNLLKKDNK